MASYCKTGPLSRCTDAYSNDLNCDPCSYGNFIVEATHFCRTCENPEPLCEDCATQHVRHKISRHHQICENIREFPNEATKTDEDSYLKEIACVPCSFENVQVKATYFCETCENPEPLCETCATQHTRQKLTRGHDISNDIWKYFKLTSILGVDLQQKEDKLCGLCLDDAKNVSATHFCKTCEDPEPLCEICAKQHTRQRAFKHHELSGNIHEFPKLSSDKSVDSQQGVYIECDPCLNDCKRVTATHFCKTCDDPEPLCEICAKQHNRQRAFKDHELSGNIHEFPIHHLIRSVDLQQDVYKKCDPCLNDDKKITATHFCKTCEDPEPLCEICAKQHIRQRAFKHHELSGNIHEFPKLSSDKSVDSQQGVYIECDPCLNDCKRVTATHFCKTCDDPEPLCEICAKQHNRQRAFKDHELSGNIHEFPIHHLNRSVDLQQDVYKECDPCLNDDKKITATHFCKTCEDPEPLCEICAKQHIRQRAFKHHELSGNIHEFPEHPSIKRISAEILRTFDDKCPGKPDAKEIKSNSVHLFWDKSNEPVDHYQIRFKAQNGKFKWKFTETDSDENNVIISGLMAYTKYTFQVRGIFGDQEGPYGPVNEDIETKESLATALLGFSVLQNKTNCPPIYLLPLQENGNARNTSARTRRLTLGTPLQDFCDEKTIMLVGATGSGKSTLVDGIVNYIMGVSFEDPLRFTMVTLEEKEKKSRNQAISQTEEWTTIYKIYTTEGSRLNFSLNIIDTPGFDDISGIERDNAIVDQIRHLFSEKGDQGVLFIDAICFIVRAQDAFLPVAKKNIFSSIMSLLGKDIESNICTLITFADGAKPPVLASLNESQLPFGLTFNFNNSALFAENKDLTNNTLSPMFWEMGCDSFERFFRHIKQLDTRSLCQTKNVLDEREHLKTAILNIRQQVSAGLSKLSQLHQQLDIFKRYKNEIEDNQNFEYEVEETRQVMIDLPKGQYVTNCIQCTVTCHEDCKIADDDKKRGCWAIDKSTGCCRICSERCIWSIHKNTPYIFRYVTETVTHTYSEMKERYEAAQGHTLTHEKYIEELTNDVEELFDLITAMMNEMNDCKNRLKEIALRPDPLSAVEHIDLMIQSEEMEKQPGYVKRLQMLKEIKRMALVDQDVQSFSQNIRVTRENIKSVTGKSFQTRIRPKVKRKGDAFTRGFQYVKNFFK